MPAAPCSSHIQPSRSEAPLSKKVQRTVEENPLVLLVSPGRPRLGERVLTGDGLAQDQRVDLVGSLIGVDRLKVVHVSNRRVLERDAVGAQNAPRRSCDVEGHTYVVEFADTDVGRGQHVVIFELPDVEREQRSSLDGDHHVDQFLLRELEGTDRGLSLIHI